MLGPATSCCGVSILAALGALPLFGLRLGLFSFLISSFSEVNSCRIVDRLAAWPSEQALNEAISLVSGSMDCWRDETNCLMPSTSSRIRARVLGAPITFLANRALSRSIRLFRVLIWSFSVSTVGDSYCCLSSSLSRSAICSSVLSLYCGENQRNYPKVDVWIVGGIPPRTCRYVA